MASPRTILITGCSDDSLGSALALALHKAGWRVFASARNPAKLKKSEEAGIQTVQLDTLSDESIASCVAKVKQLTGGSLDGLLNNAGAGYNMPLLDVDLAKARQLFDLNVWSLITVTRGFLPLLIKSTHGAIVVNNTSGASLTAGSMPFSGAYNASKAAATGLTETLRLELEPFNIKVINLITGGVRSTFYNNAPVATLPSTSLYNIAKEPVEKAMSGADVNGSDPAQWADGVAKELSKSNPPHWVWKGKFSTIVRIASHLPIGSLDGPMKAMVGLDAVEKKIKEQGGPSKIYFNSA
ncbi:hypothetical protein F5Y12DRAFT_310574 [Xylaria sp. FL1777]|nr:hypothetical protein F5Y12DRAFT_310574 [Xylaria sp. FL1777]